MILLGRRCGLRRDRSLCLGSRDPLSWRAAVPPCPHSVCGGVARTRRVSDGPSLCASCEMDGMRRRIANAVFEILRVDVRLVRKYQYSLENVLLAQCAASFFGYVPDFAGEVPGFLFVR